MRLAPGPGALRACVAVALLLAAGGTTAWLISRGTGTPPASLGLAADSLVPASGQREPAFQPVAGEAGPQPVRAASDGEALADPLAGLPAGYRLAGGVARRQEDRRPVRATLRTAGGDHPVTLGSTSLGGLFLVRVPPGVTAMESYPQERYDLEIVNVPLPEGRTRLELEILHPRARGSLFVRVVDESGRDAEGVEVTLNATYARRTSGADGGVRFQPLRDGHYEVALADLPFTRITRAGVRAPAEIQGARQVEPVQLVVVRGAALCGVVVDGRGVAIPAAKLVLGRAGDSRKHRVAAAESDGAFRFARLMAGSYVLTAMSDDGSHGRTVMEVAALGENEERTLRVVLDSTAGAVAGVLEDEAGEPLPFASVVARRARAIALAPGVAAGAGEAGGGPAGSAESPAPAETRLIARTDTRGRFRFDALATGAWLVGIEPRYGETHNWLAVETAVEVRDAQETEVRLRARHGLWIRGTVETRADLARLRLQLRLREPGGAWRDEPLAPSGRFAFGGLSPGSYTLEILDSSLGNGTMLAQRQLFLDRESPKPLKIQVP